MFRRDSSRWAAQYTAPLEKEAKAVFAAAVDFPHDDLGEPQDRIDPLSPRSWCSFGIALRTAASECEVVGVGEVPGAVGAACLGAREASARLALGAIVLWGGESGRRP